MESARACDTARSMLRQLALGVEIPRVVRPGGDDLTPDGEERWDLLEAISTGLREPERGEICVALLRHLALAPVASI
jgi:hypothetical protein